MLIMIQMYPRQILLAVLFSAPVLAFEESKVDTAVSVSLPH